MYEHRDSGNQDDEVLQRFGILKGLRRNLSLGGSFTPRGERKTRKTSSGDSSHESETEKARPPRSPRSIFARRGGEATTVTVPENVMMPSVRKRAESQP